MNLNIPEILVANGAGIVMVAFLFLFRIKQQHSHQVHEQIFNAMLVSILLALIGEAMSFCIDGRDFTGCSFLQYLMNAICLSQTAVGGFLWCLFVDYRIYYSKKRLNKKVAILSIPLIVHLAMLLGDLFGAGLIFEIATGNVYVRGKLCGLTCIVVMIFFVESIINSCTAQRKGVVPFLPCILVYDSLYGWHGLTRVFLWNFCWMVISIYGGSIHIHRTANFQFLYRYDIGTV